MYNLEKKKVLLGDFCREIKYESVYVDFLSQRDVEILTKIGIPDSLAPYISIKNISSFGGYSLYNRINIHEGYKKEDELFKELCFIGSVDYGYIVIQKEGTMAIYNYEEELSYLNGSLDSFLDCAYEFAKFISEVNEKYGEDATLKETI